MVLGRPGGRTTSIAICDPYYRFHRPIRRTVQQPPPGPVGIKRNPNKGLGPDCPFLLSP